MSLRDYDRVLITATLLLVGIGIVMIYSSSAIRAQERFGDPSLFLKRQLLWALLGTTAMAWAMRVDYHTWQGYSPVLYLIALLGLLAVLIPGIGVQIKGARRWIHLFGLSVQPSELAKLSLILYLAAYFSRKPERAEEFTRGILQPLLLAGLFAGLVMLEPNIGTALILMLITFTLFFLTGTRLTHLGLTLLTALPLLLLVTLLHPHARTRILAAVDPSRAASSPVLYQVTQSLYALGPGGVWGRGLGESIQKLFYLPEPHTDFIFAIIGEEVGFVGASAIILLFGLLLWRGTRAAVRAPDLFGSYLGMGLTAALIMQALINLGVVVGLLPTTGVPLPLVSFGGSSLVVTLFSMGILLNISRQGRIPAERGRGA